MQPFITFITMTHKRPKQLAACLASVGAQTAVDDIEQIVLPDHIGLGIVEGFFGRLGMYVDAIHGQYVHVLADDDILPDPGSVARVRAFAIAKGYPPVIVTTAQKGAMTLPCASLDPPVCGAIDMACFVQRADIFKAHVHEYVRHHRYEGDFDHAYALWAAGIPFAQMDELFVVGGASHGVPEAVV